jgi:HEAT repeat protein
MLKNGFKPGFAVIAFVLICLLSSTTHATDNPMFKKQLTETIAKVRKGRTSNIRTDAAEHLARLTQRIDPNNVDHKTLEELVSLLDTSEDSVRLWVAASLGNLGPRAKVAVPTLLKLLPEVDCLRGSLTSAPAVRAALERIGVAPPPPPECGTQSK